MPLNQSKVIENSAPQYTPRPLAKHVSYEKDEFYNILIFDTETNTTGKSAEVCQLSVTDKSGLHTFSKFIMPTQDIDFHASRINKLKIVNINGERKLRKDSIVVSALPFNEVIAHFLRFVSQSVNRAKLITNSQPL